MISLPIFWHNDETERLDIMEINYDLKDCPIQEVIFLNVDAITSYEEDGEEYTTIFSGGNNFTSPLSMKEVLTKLQEQ